MEALAELERSIRKRVIDLGEIKKAGKKIIGVLPGDFVPEEIIYAAGAIPLGMIHGGTAEPVEAASFAAARLLCPFSKTPIGLWSLEHPYYQLADLIVVPISCNHMRRVADMLWYFSDKEVVYLGIPHEQAANHALEYYKESVITLKKRLEELTGKNIHDRELKEACILYNNIRASLRQISELRKSDDTIIKGSDFLKLNHYSYICDPVVTNKALGKIIEELARKDSVIKNARARLLLAGPNLSMGDNKVISIIERLGADIVVEEICEGIRFYWKNISLEGNLLDNICEKYLKNRIPYAFQGQGTEERMKFIQKLCKEFNIDGVVWYELRYCETYNLEFYYIQKFLEKLGIPIIKVESDYNPGDEGSIITRLDAFFEMIERRKGNV